MYFLAILGGRLNKLISILFLAWLMTCQLQLWQAAMQVTGHL